MSRVIRIAFALAISAVVAGCDFGRHHLGELKSDRVFEVESGDRVFCSLNEDLSSGHRWEATCDDDDVEVSVVHRAGKGEGALPDRADITFQVHRGYDGPSAIRIFSRAPAKAGEKREFSVLLYRITGDRAFWR